MRIAVPVERGLLAFHFRHASLFVLVDAENHEIRSTRVLTPPPLEPRKWPRWLKQQGATVVIASGMGARAQDVFRRSGVDVVVGAKVVEPSALVRELLDGRLATGVNATAQQH